ncbi:MAG TPA: response regulator [Methanospirillum sp.]|uniref:response regulator n=1 Tax=Methanospirillum sp. TaxID=45200 RepID=UPI002BF7103C|nr:response regulator [Methanospirillum sp.]HOJ95343.1 response regulator [Methanospirillum sp.]
MKTSPDRSLQILIVEDNRTQAEYLRHLLEKKGHQVTVSNNGYEALEKLKIERPDIILTDVMMPDMDGFTLCKMIKSDETYHDIPVILVTHLYSPVDVIKGLEAGADNFIIKPYDPEYIFSRIAGIMQAKEHPGSNESNQPLDVVFSSEVHTIASSRMQILNILLSTYETAVKNNSELQVAHERLHYTNAQLQKLVEDLEQTNESLHLKNLERGRLETALTAAQQKIETLSEALRRVCQTWLYPAEELLRHQVSSSSTSQEIADAASHLHAGLIALTNSRQYLKAATVPRTWQGIRNCINAAVEPVRRQTIRYENLIPEDIEIYADPCLKHVLRDIVVALQDDGGGPSEIRFSFHVKDNGYVIICENNERGVAQTDKNDIFSIHEGLNSYPSLCFVREMLALSGLEISETGIAGHRTRFEIACPEPSIRFGSDIQVI